MASLMQIAPRLAPLNYAGQYLLFDTYCTWVTRVNDHNVKEAIEDESARKC
jgi:hypothetical protein